MSRTSWTPFPVGIMNVNVVKRYGVLDWVGAYWQQLGEGGRDPNAKKREKEVTVFESGKLYRSSLDINIFDFFFSTLQICLKVNIHLKIYLQKRTLKWLAAWSLTAWQFFSFYLCLGLCEASGLVFVFMWCPEKQTSGRCGKHEKKKHTFTQPLSQTAQTLNRGVVDHVWRLHFTRNFISHKHTKKYLLWWQQRTKTGLKEWQRTT